MRREPDDSVKGARPSQSSLEELDLTFFTGASLALHVTVTGCAVSQRNKLFAVLLHLRDTTTHVGV